MPRSVEPEASLAPWCHMAIPVKQISGEVTMVEATPDTTIDQFKDLVLQTLRAGDDESRRKVTEVQLFLAEKQLPDAPATLEATGVSADADLLAVFSTRSVECVRRTLALCDLTREDKHVHLSIPVGCTDIGVFAFARCSSIQTLEIPSSVTAIGGGAFTFCTSLTSLRIPDSVSHIQNETFSGCSSLTSLTIPDSVIIIGDMAFNECSSLTSVTIPSSVQWIGMGAFALCSALTSLTIGSSVTHIGGSAFRSCRSLTSLTIPNPATFIAPAAFTGCRSLMSVTIPRGMPFDRDSTRLPKHCEVIEL